MAVVFVLLGLTLFRLLDGVHRRAGTALLVFVAVGAGSILVNLTFQVGALLTATDPAYDAATTLLLLDLHGTATRSAGSSSVSGCSRWAGPRSGPPCSRPGSACS